VIPEQRLLPSLFYPKGIIKDKLMTPLDIVDFARSLGADVAEVVTRLFAGDFHGASSVLEGVAGQIRSLADLDQGPASSPEQGSVADDGSLWTIQTWFLDRGLEPAQGPEGSIPSHYVWSPKETGEWVWRPPV